MPRSLTFVPIAVLEKVAAEADRAYPNETGGVLVGYQNGPDTVITDMLGPGPSARHRRSTFSPDHIWQSIGLTDIYFRTGDLYLGDWHTHPDAAHGALSIIDKIALWKVIRSPAARIPDPISAIFFGTPLSWTGVFWRGTSDHVLCLPTLTVRHLDVVEY